MKTFRSQFVSAATAAAIVSLSCACAAQPADKKPAEWAPSTPNPNAPYPAESRLNSEQGTVLLRVRTTPEGKPMAVEVKESSGYPRLDRSATDTVWKWQFRPTPDDATVVWREVPIRFFITSQPQSPTLN